MAAANDLRKGQAIKYNGNTAIVLDVQHRTPGNLRAFVQAIIRYINTGKSADVRFGSTDKGELADISRTTLEFSYRDNTGSQFMDRLWSIATGAYRRFAAAARQRVEER